MAEVNLSKEEIYRYSRHLLIPEVGLKGQKKLKESRVLVVGAGGLGSPVALYLAAAGIGTIGIVDFDVVDESNLQRQILHGTDDIGIPKVESAKKKLLEINPYIEVVTYNLNLSKENVLNLIKDYDVIVDGTDNFPTRYLLNDACAFLQKPLVYGSIFRFEGQVTVFDVKKGPCYRCLYPEPPPPGTVPSCAEGGVFGVLPGVIGSIQATEVIKHLLGLGRTLVGKLLFYDALNMEFRFFNLKKDPKCPLCGENPTITELQDYEVFCGVDTAKYSEEYFISPAELKERLEKERDRIVILDVREPHEWEISSISGSLFIPLSELPQRLHTLDSTKEYVVICKVGQRSLSALEILIGAGFKAYNLKGGINAWAKEVDQDLPIY